jgi:hypothetical protein
MLITAELNRPEIASRKRRIWRAGPSFKSAKKLDRDLARSVSYGEGSALSSPISIRGTLGGAGIRTCKQAQLEHDAL